MSKVNVDVVIIGAGAAGLMCAIEAGKRGRSVAVLEHNDTVGKKIRISGGGRCNFTNIHSTPANFISNNPHFCKSAFSRYTPVDFLNLVKSHKIAVHEKKLGQMFCDGSAQEIIDLLLEECAKYKVKIHLQTSVKDVRKPDDFTVSTNKDMFECASLVIATGGLSIPKIGATDFGYRIAKQFQMKLKETRPGLVPLISTPRDLNRFKNLSGVSADCLVKIGKTVFRENILFTHRGLSGPAVLQISSYWKPEQSIEINFLPEIMWDKEFEDIRSSGQKISARLKKILPERLIETWMIGVPDVANAQLSKQQWDNIRERFQRFVFMPKDTEGYEKAEVTLGGVDTSELSSQTMEARSVAGLYFIGEVVDVTGHLGGHNFQWAWASGFAAGQVV